MIGQLFFVVRNKFTGRLHTGSGPNATPKLYSWEKVAKQAAPFKWPDNKDKYEIVPVTLKEFQK